MRNTYHVRAWKAYNAEVKWWFVNVEVSDDDTIKNFEFLYHDEPDEKLIKVCSLRALRAFGLEELDELNNPFDPNNSKYFPINPTSIKVVEEDESYESSVRTLQKKKDFYDPDKKANDFDDEEEEMA